MDYCLCESDKYGPNNKKRGEEIETKTLFPSFLEQENYSYSGFPTSLKNIHELKNKFITCKRKISEAIKLGFANLLTPYISFANQKMGQLNISMYLVL